MLSPVALGSSPEPFFYQINRTSSLSISSHITHSSPDHPGLFSLTQSLLSQRAQTRHSTPDVSPSTQRRNITLPSPCWLCLCWYSPAGEATRTRWWCTLSFQCLTNPSMQSAPSLPSCTAVTSQGQDQNLTILSSSPLDSWACSPFYQPLPSQSAASTEFLGLYWSITVSTTMKDSSQK